MAFYLAFYLTIFLTFYLAFYPASIPTFYLACVRPPSEHENGVFQKNGFTQKNKGVQNIDFPQKNDVVQKNDIDRRTMLVRKTILLRRAILIKRTMPRSADPPSWTPWKPHCTTHSNNPLSISFVTQNKPEERLQPEEGCSGPYGFSQVKCFKSKNPTFS